MENSSLQNRKANSKINIYFLAKEKIIARVSGSARGVERERQERQTDAQRHRQKREAGLLTKKYFLKPPPFSYLVL